MAENILEIKNLVVEYHTDESIVHAANGINLSVKRGETIGLVGETGAGKTTIARSILRILPMPPAKLCDGEILYNGQNLLELPEAEMRKIRGSKISMIFQDPMTALNPIETVGWQIAEAIKLHDDIGKAEATVKACQMLELVGIPSDRYNEYPHQFSGGMKQRVVIAMALACNPELLLADEPTTALDVTIQAQVLELMRDLQEKLGTAMLLITHDLGVVADTCNKVAIMYAGQIVEMGSLEDVYDNTKHPYTKGLFGSLPSLSIKSKRLVPIDGLMPDPVDLPSGCPFHPRCPDCMESCKSRMPVKTEVSPGHYVRCLRCE